MYSMSKTSLSFFFLFAFALFAFAALMCAAAAAQSNFKVIHSFKGPPSDASYVVSRLVFDAQGNLYGTSANGGAASQGTVFKLSPNGDGTWAESVIYSLCSVSVDGECLDGAVPWAGLVLGAKGNLYGTTTGGGSQYNCPIVGMYGCGVVFELSPPHNPGGTWTETVLYNFCSMFSGTNCLDGYTPQAPLVFDAQGNLYGTSDGGNGHAPGGSGGGMVFELSPAAGVWKQTVLYNFCSIGRGEACPDGDFPYLAGVTFNSSGNLYGTTAAGGSTKTHGGGTVYELSPGVGGWAEKVLAALPSSANGYREPSGGIAIDPAGNLYGTFELPGGGVFELNPETGRRRVFLFNGADGYEPLGGVTLDTKRGVLYGTTAGGLIGNIFEIDSKGNETVLYTFCSQSNCVDGQDPWGTLVQDKAGNLYGTTEFGGEYGAGVVFEITP